MANADIRVNVRGDDTDHDWTNLTVVQAHGMHVVAALTYRQKVGTQGSLSGRSFYRDRSHIKVTYGVFPSSGGNSTSLTGYITSHRVSAKKKDRRGPYVQVTYYITGTSYPMQGVHHWTGKSWSSAAKAVAARHKLKPRVHRTPRLKRPIIQTTSDFRFLAEGAKKIGYRFYVDGPTLYFLDPTQMLNTSYARNTPFFGNTEIVELDVHADEESADAGETIVGRSPAGQVIEVTYSSESDEEHGEDDGYISAPAIVNDDDIVEDYAEADEAVRAASPTWVTANLEAVGNVKVRPGVVVNLGGTIPDDHQGLWMATEVTHIVNLTKSRAPKVAYHIEAVLGRDRMRPIPIPAVEEAGDPEYSTESDVPWEAMSENDWQDEDVEAIEIDGEWQAEFYGEDVDA